MLAQKKRIYLGIDPGSASGCIAAVDENGQAIFAKEVAGTPFEVWASVKPFLNSDLYAIHSATLEKVGARPDQGAPGMFKFATNFGVWQGMLLALGVTYDLVAPQMWKKQILSVAGLGKDGSLDYCRKKYRNIDYSLKKDHGRADATCLAEWGWRRAHTVGFEEPSKKAPAKKKKKG